MLDFIFGRVYNTLQVLSIMAYKSGDIKSCLMFSRIQYHWSVLFI